MQDESFMYKCREPVSGVRGKETETLTKASYPII